METVASRRAGKGSKHLDFLSMYRDATDKDGKTFSASELPDELVTLIVAGFETQLADSGDPGLELAINLRSARDIVVQPVIRNDT